MSLATHARIKSTNKLAAISGFLYGAILAFFAVAWGVDGPTLTLPLATSPLMIPAAILDNWTSSNVHLKATLILTPIVLAPFGWMVLAYEAARATITHRRTICVSVLIAHYAGIALSFVSWGDYLLRPFRVLTTLGAVLIAFYAAGQVLLWWVLIANKKARELSLD